MPLLHFLRPFLRPLLISLSAITFLILSGCGSAPETKSAEAIHARPARHTPQYATPKHHNRPDRRNEVIMQAMSLLDTQYKRGGVHPVSGMDCSGYVRFVFRQAWDVELPRTSLAQSKVSAPLKVRDLEKGDLVFYNTRRRKFSHVGIYLGNNQFIHSPSPGGRVRIESMSVAYWKKRYNGARRVKDPGQ